MATSRMMYSTSSAILLVVLLSALLFLTTPVSAFSFGASARGGREDNWAVIISTSRYWHNYRHSANALSLYRLCRMHGIDDDHIILFLSDNIACDSRNSAPGQVYGDKQKTNNLYGCDAHPDFVGYESDLRRFLQVMQGRYDDTTPVARRLLSTNNSNVLFYMTGHGGDGFMKFQDSEFLTNEDIGETIKIMHAQQRFKNMLFLAETCQAASLCEHIQDTPNVLCVAASHVGQDSYSHHSDPLIGSYVIDAFSYELLRLAGGFNVPTRRNAAAVSSSKRSRSSKTSSNDGEMCMFSSAKWSLRTYFSKFVTAPSKIFTRNPTNWPTMDKDVTVADFFCGSAAAASPSPTSKNKQTKGAAQQSQDLEEREALFPVLPATDFLL